MAKAPWLTLRLGPVGKGSALPQERDGNRPGFNGQPCSRLSFSYDQWLLGRRRVARPIEDLGL